ncbi:MULTISPECIES: NAD(P)H-binding protein [unclassified Microbacterium]|uniref:NAD(P)H-binding protein n=1 Tax=unclassified Microbacterium TaxID=2609290 RepID=UPI001D65E0E2|nr:MULTISPECIES: NAD(P)H-binding protein [unclassified Microbacterium]CAH0164377.1 putative sugar epimerase YhfK [Microbacterium sp. Bi121]HWK78768.1 NAD(P)H-binding protein [Microbacterium sp.]
MSRVIVFGGHGRIALLLAPILVARGDEVTSVIRNPEHVAEVEQTGATALVADVEQLGTAAIAELIRGHDAAVWSAGAGGGLPERTYAVDRDAAIRSMDAAASADVKRYIMVSWLGSTADHGVPESDSFFAYADAKWAADEHLRGTDLDGTILGPGTLTFDEPTGLIDLEAPDRGRVSRADVAAVIAAALVEPLTIGRTVRFGNGTADSAEPISVALAR